MITGVLRSIHICLLAVVISGCSAVSAIEEERSPVQTMFVGPHRVECNNPFRNNVCYQVKPKMEDAWQLYTGDIMGFQYEQGKIYELLVQADTKSSLSFNSPEVQWVLVQLISSQPAPDPTAIPAELQDQLWTLAQFGNPGQLTDALGESLPTIFFQKDGHFTGSSGCNRFNGKYTFNGDEIQFEGLAATKKMCPAPDGMLEQEQTIFYILQQTGRFTVVDQSLSIYTRGDERVLIFRR